MSLAPRAAGAAGPLDAARSEIGAEGPAGRGWLARLQLSARMQGGRCTLRHEHIGPLRVLKALYPEGPGICHQVLVHPPGGIVGGDRLELDLELGEAAHLLLTTPGATRWYRSAGPLASQHLRARIGPQARLEWLPLETLVHDGARAESRQRFVLEPGAEMIGWELLALGLPAAGSPFVRGSVLLDLQMPGLWIERGRIDATDAALLDGASGFAGRRVLGLAWWAAGPGVAAGRAELALRAGREVLEQALAEDPAPAQAEAPATAPSALAAAFTAPQPRLAVLRLLAHDTESAMRILRRVRAAWREALWALEGHAPRLWST